MKANFLCALLGIMILAAYKVQAQEAGKTYYIQSAIAKKNLDVKWGKSDNGTPLHLWPYNGGAAQKFTLEDAGGGYFYIKSALGKYLHITGGSSQPGALPVLWEGKGKDNTKWKFINVADGYQNIQSKKGTYLDVQYAKPDNGTPIWMYNGNGGIAQKWKLISLSSTTSATAKMTNFDPEKHGFKFSNRFDNHGFVAGANINFTGLCGGMTYASLDYYYQRVPIPTQASKPNEGTALTAYIRARQWDTYSKQGDEWIELGFNPLGWRTSEFWNWGIQGFDGGRLEELKKQIDRGRPVPLGLFAAGDAGFAKAHHQVVAIGYDMGRYKGDLKNHKEDLKIFIYDPNYPDKIMTLIPNVDKLRYCYLEKPEKEWLTYFVDLDYSSAVPLNPQVINRCTNTDFTGQNMQGKTLNNKNYRCIKADGVNFYGATISGTDFEQGALNRANFYGANLTNTTFYKANVSDANFTGADLKNATLSHANVVKSDFQGADMKFIKMLSAKAQYSDFQGADLHRGDFSETNFADAKLIRTSLNTAKCPDADFSRANLDGADLRGANLRGADFKDAIITRNTKFDSRIVDQVKNWPGIR